MAAITVRKATWINKVKASVVNVATVPQRSPFRYPGGKTWLIPYIRQWLTRVRPVDHLVEPFAGGGIVSLTAVCENLAKRATLVEKDSHVAAVWRTLLNGGAHRLADRITDFEISLENVKSVLAAPSEDVHDRAFATILRNRVGRGGILAPGAGLLKEGENGRGLRSRWYPETLKKRILAISEVKNRLSFIEGDGMLVMCEHSAQEDAAFFIDPPYTVAGRRLYAHSEINHKHLFEIINTLAGDFLMTYDHSAEICALARQFQFQAKLIPMKSTHHECKHELLIGKDLSWLSGPREQPTLF